MTGSLLKFSACRTVGPDDKSRIPATKIHPKQGHLWF